MPITHRTPREVRAALSALSAEVGSTELARAGGAEDRSTATRWVSGELPLYLDTACAVARAFQGQEWAEHVRVLGRALALAIADAAGLLDGGAPAVSPRVAEQTFCEGAAEAATLAAEEARLAARIERDGVVDRADLPALQRLEERHITQIDRATQRLALVRQHRRTLDGADIRLVRPANPGPGRRS
ncbi:MAG: hypothetical protein AMXMBFR64_57640 [Myxococcales bacterium]